MGQPDDESAKEAGSAPSAPAAPLRHGAEPSAPKAFLILTIAKLVRPRPPLWLNPLTWGIVGGVMLGLVYITGDIAGPQRFQSGNYVAPQADGSFKLMPDGSAPGTVEVSSYWYYRRGLGWEAWEEGPVIFQNSASGAPAVLTQEQQAAMRRLAFQACVDETQAKQRAHGADQDEAGVELTAVTMLRDGETQIVRGRVYGVRRPVKVLGWVVVGIAAVLRLLRNSTRGYAASNLANAAKGLCPKCDYDLRGLAGPSRCPECGVDVGREMRMARMIMGTGPKRSAAAR